ncbi:MAG: hypothetical protein J6K96_12015 [Treponema sp.]|nr:hypothetical protein [Treponema sp.]
MKKIIIAAHGNSRKGLGDPSAKTITKAEQPLSFGEAKAYMDGAFFPEYASASMSEFSPLSDADCLDLFGTVPQGTGIVSTGKRRGNQIHGEEIFALRNQSMCLSEIGIIARREKIEVVMLACRTY